MKSVFLLQHTYDIEGEGNIKFEETKIIGIYSSKEKAEKVIEKYKTLKGFRRFPVECFVIDEYKIDRNHWEEGFITWDSEEADWEDDED